jgi:tRNA threonylcarbamoyladenosine biosynthesis protein TsaB
MIVLGFDTATAATAVGLLAENGSLLEVRHDPAPGERPGHATQLLALATDLLDQAGLSLADVGRIGVGTGPGTFTGLRIGVTTARALAQATGAELSGVSTLRTLAAGAFEGGAGAFERGAGARPVLSVIDARRGEAFAATYRIGGAPGGVEQMTPPRAVAPEVLGGLVKAADPELAPSQWMAVGDGAIRFREHLEQARIDVPPDDSAVHRVSAGALCRLAATGPAVSLWKLTPDYLRVPDADLAPRSRP